MKINQENGPLYVLFGGAFIYLMLFQFIIPQNQFFPQPTEIFYGIIALFEHYNLAFSLASTASAFIISTSISFLIIWMFSGQIINFYLRFSFLRRVIKFFNYIPIIFIPILFLFWLHNNYWVEYIFIFVVSNYFLKTSIFKQLNNYNKTYALVAKNLGVGENKIASEIIWKTILPEIKVNALNKLPILLLLIMVFEYVSESYGVGAVLRNLFEFGDFTGFIALGIILSILSAIVYKLYSYFLNKLIYWE